jgi:regulator of CtrA degradation
MAVKDAVEEKAAPVSFVERLAASDAFISMFREGMSLVEESAAYLDGPGREESKVLSRTAALAYAAESMRLTTRLMQIASWLLLQRAVNQGEMTRIQAANDRNRTKLSLQELATSPDAFATLPNRIRELSLRSLRLQARIVHLDGLIYSEAIDKPLAPKPSAIEEQMKMLRSAFPRQG